MLFLKVSIDKTISTFLECLEAEEDSGVSEYQVQFIGGSDVGKTSIIDQFLRSEHDDVFNKDFLIRVSDELNLFSRYLLPPITHIDCFSV